MAKKDMTAKMIKPETMTNSPCAKLMVPEVCHKSAKPDSDQSIDGSGRDACNQKLNKDCHTVGYL